MSVVINVHYEGDDGAARAFVDDVVSEGLLEAVRSEDGCQGYEYYASLEDPGRILLVEHWRDEVSLEAHIAAENLAHIEALKERHGVVGRVERFAVRTGDEKGGRGRTPRP